MDVLGGVASVCDGTSHLTSSSLCMYCKRNGSGAKGHGAFSLGHL